VIDLFWLHKFDTSNIDGIDLFLKLKGFGNVAMKLRL